MSEVERLGGINPELAEALIKAQSEIGPIVKDTDGQVGTRNYKYADLASILAAVREPLKNNGLFLTQDAPNGSLITSLFHKSGHALTSSVPLVVSEQATSQQFGSALTYARRYGLCAILGIQAEDDDDGAAAQSAPGKRRATKPAGEPPKQSLHEAQLALSATMHRVFDREYGGKIQPKDILYKCALIISQLRGHEIIYADARQIPYDDLVAINDHLNAKRPALAAGLGPDTPTPKDGVAPRAAPDPMAGLRATLSRVWGQVREEDIPGKCAIVMSAIEKKNVSFEKISDIGHDAAVAIADYLNEKYPDGSK